jgi:inorganic pyrophosphatase
MVELSSLPHNLDPATGFCRAVVESSKGSRGKFTYNPVVRAFELTGLLPSGMSFPLDFGFIPSTRAEDGDPIAVMILHDEPIPTGCLIPIRLLGVIEGEQGEKGERIRNDRLVAASQVSHLYADIMNLGDFPEPFARHLGDFWVNYNRTKNKRYKVLRAANARSAIDLLEKASSKTSL